MIREPDLFAVPRQVLAFSGGKDSTACALLMKERGEDFDLLFTPTGNELPSLISHMSRIVELTGKPLILPTNQGLDFWINHFGSLPNHRQRWCTRLIKIVPCLAYLKANPGITLCVGLRADEPEREGLYGDDAIYRFPLREAGLELDGVLELCDRYDCRPPDRTDCALCPYQRLAEWFMLWRDHIGEWMKGEAYEAQTGFTFRSPGRDSWPAAMVDLRALFEAGKVPEVSMRNMERDRACRVCSL